MGIIGRLVWMNTCSKKQCRGLFWRMRAFMKKAVKKHTFLVALNGGPKKQLNFHYDPSSYALNFDDGTYHHLHHDDDHHHNVVELHKMTKIPLPKLEESHPLTTTWVYVIWVESF